LYTPRPCEGAEIVGRVGELGRHSDSPDHYTRTLLHAGAPRGRGQIASWMREAGMAVRVDGVGNVIGRYEARGRREDAPHGLALRLGAQRRQVRRRARHPRADRVRRELARRGERLPVALEVAAFSDEEGARFQTSFLSSRALVGRFDPQALERRDADGVLLADAMRAAGLDPAHASRAALDPSRLAAYVEVHIEQGPVLLDAKHALGVVTSIASGIRYLVRVRGEAGHAGTVPMARRRDALAATAEMVLAVESQCAAIDSAVGTVGLLKVRDGPAT
jgi:allantoate deiminase